MLSVGLANNAIRCSAIELVMFDPPSGQTCGQYMQQYISTAGGYLQNPDVTSGCQFCSAANTNVYLEQLSSQYSTRWRNFGVMWAFIIFNIVVALFLYWLARVPRKQKVQDEPTLDPASRVQSKAAKADQDKEKVDV